MSRPLAVAVCVLIALALLAAMRWGWVRRARRTGAGLAQLPEPWEPAAPDEEAVVVEGTYVSTTSAGDWLDRIATAGLGVRSPVSASVDARGLLLSRRGAPDVAIPASDLLLARRERGIAGKVAQPGGIVVVRWTLGDRELDTGVRPRYERDRNRLVDAVNNLVSQKGQPTA